MPSRRVCLGLRSFLAMNGFRCWLGIPLSADVVFADGELAHGPVPWRRDLAPEDTTVTGDGELAPALEESADFQHEYRFFVRLQGGAFPLGVPLDFRRCRAVGATMCVGACGGGFSALLGRARP